LEFILKKTIKTIYRWCTMKVLSEETDTYKIVGDNLEMLIVKVGNSHVFSEAEKMIYTKSNIRMETKMGSQKKKGLFGKLLNAGKRMLVREPCFSFILKDRERWDLLEIFRKNSSHST